MKINEIKSYEWKDKNLIEWHYYKFKTSVTLMYGTKKKKLIGIGLDDHKKDSILIRRIKIK
jgi:hypothetical protein